MTNSEQAIREFAEKIVPVILNSGLLCNTEEIIEAFTGDLTALISEHYYPKEFTKWIGFNSSALYYRDVDEKWIKTRFVISENSSEEYDEYTTDELYNYWKENEQEEHPTNKEKFDGNYLPDPD